MARTAWPPPFPYCLAIDAGGMGVAFNRCYRPMWSEARPLTQRALAVAVQSRPWLHDSRLTVHLPAGFQPVRMLWLWKDGTPTCERKRIASLIPSAA